jgi:RNA polymerase sigma factor (sigma-70 family)
MTVPEGKALLDHGKAIARRYARLVGPDMAEELRGEAVLRALRSPPPDGRMEPWLERIYRNLCVDLWRRGQLVRPDTTALAELAGGATPEEEAGSRERRRAVRAGLARLPRAARRALVARYYVDLDDERAAACFGVTATTVRTRIHRARVRLRGRLGDLRAWCPPVFGKLGAQAAALGLAPVLVTVLVVIGASDRVPAPVDPPPLASTVAQHRAAGPARGPVRTETPTVRSTPQARARIVRKVVAATAIRASSPPVEGLALAGDEPVVGEILRPESVDIFAEPARPEPPCLVAAPRDFAPQIEKMIEERL